MDIFPVGVTGNALGFDPSYPTNPDYLGTGTTGDSVYIDHDGDTFTLLQLTYTSNRLAVVRSSKGGVLELGPVDHYLTVTVAGAQWEDVQWFEVSGNCSGYPCTLMDDFVISLTPTSSTCSLLLFGAIAAAYRRKRVVV